VSAASREAQLQRKSAGPGIARPQGMIWFYERRGSHLRCEVRQAVEGDRAYELVITDPQGHERVEVFCDSKELTRRSRQLEDEWRTEGWDGPYMRFL
jgi:hypothetical protein